MDREKARAHKAYLTKRRRQRRLDAVNARKGDTCMDCGGVFHPCQIDLDHVDQANKVASINWMVRNGTWEQLISELEKVIPVCANCHRMRTYYRVFWYPEQEVSDG